MNSDIVDIAIIGSGPAGLSAACRAAEQGDSHVLFEAQPHLSNTIFRYQKGKHVMAEPGVLPLRASAAFEAGAREQLLAQWGRDVARHKVNVRLRAEVVRIIRNDEGFGLELSDGQTCQARNVVLAIGVQGNPRRMGVPGEELPCVQYQLDDPDEYRDEVIVVVGAGDAAIENAVALARHNKVHIVNRKGEFSRAKDGNNQLILQAIERGRVSCHYLSAPESVTAAEAGGRRMTLRLDSRQGSVDIGCDRIIARLGAIPQRTFIEACGIRFPNDDPAAVPQVSARYESNVPGLYLIGALAGYPLIKQAMNQGYEVVEFIQRRPVEPADEPLLRRKLKVFSAFPDVDLFLDILADRSEMLGSMNRLQLRELLLESRFLEPREGSRIYQAGDFGTAMYLVMSGTVRVQTDPKAPEKAPELKGGDIFGEMAVISGRPRAAAVVAGERCVLLEVPRRTMLKLLAANEGVRTYVDRVFATRALDLHLLSGADVEQFSPLIESATLCEFKAGQPIYTTEDPADAVHLIRSGSVALSGSASGREVVMQYLAAGQHFGEVDIIVGTQRSQTARAAIKTQTIRVPAASFLDLLDRNPRTAASVKARFREKLAQQMRIALEPERGERIEFLLQQGFGEATDALLIDESLCVRCDQCEKACAATHGNVSRLDREAGATFDNLHVPTSCRHCEHPHCMKDCPPDAIHRAINGEVYIESTCIGCGNCERNCPYGVIQMGVKTDDKPSLWRWLLLGQGPAPGDEVHDYPQGASKKAVKCDMCKDRADGPACVQACPTGAAIRVGPEAFFEVLARGGR